jgi:signal transduction histidine kinase/FixJ family two-component response regulator
MTVTQAALTDPRVRAEVVALLYSNAAVGVLMNLISIPLIWWAYRSVVPSTLLNSALALWACLQLASAWNRRAWKNLPTEQQREARTSRAFLQRAQAMAVALSLGMALLLAVLHFADLPATPAIAAVLALVYVLGACTSTLIYLPLVRVFSSVVLGSQALLLANSDEAVSWLLAALLFALILGLWGYGKRYSAQLQQVIVLRFEVQDLLAQQERLRDTAEAANQAKSRFFAAASHDVRQPLQAVMLTFHALRFARSDERRSQLLNDAERNLGALRQLFDQVLDISRIDAGALPIAPQAVPLQVMFDKLEARFAGEAAAKQVWLRFAATPRAVHSDPDALERMLANLVGNAIKYTERGGVWVGLRSARGRIEVRDSGVGIAEAQHERIFDEFFQVDNPGRDRASGLGLGLSIVRRLGDRLHHAVGLVSAPERGSTFWIGVTVVDAPVAEVNGDVLPPLARASDADVTLDALIGCSIVLIENDAQVAHALQDLLWQAGASVTHFATAEAALAAVPPQPRRPTLAAPEVVISDYRLSGALDGAEAVRQLRSAWQQDIGAIVLTGDTAIRDLTRIDAALHTSTAPTRTRLLHKPVPAAQLIEAVHAVRRGTAPNEASASSFCG